MSKKRAAEIVVPPVLRELAAHAHATPRVLHSNPIRRQMVVWLLLEDEISFKALQSRSGMIPGHLSYQMGLLEQAGYVEVRKTFEGRRPVTSYRLTPAGLAAWETYCRHMDALMEGLKAIGEQKQAHWPGDGEPERMAPG